MGKMREQIVDELELRLVPLITHTHTHTHTQSPAPGQPPWFLIADQSGSNWG